MNVVNMLALFSDILDNTGYRGKHPTNKEGFHEPDRSKGKHFRMEEDTITKQGGGRKEN